MFTYNQIIDLNGKLAEHHLHYKLHYLNEQEAAFDPLGHCACEGTEETFETFIKEAMEEEDIQVVVDWKQYRIRTI